MIANAYNDFSILMEKGKPLFNPIPGMPKDFTKSVPKPKGKFWVGFLLGTLVIVTIVGGVVIYQDYTKNKKENS